MSSAEVLASVRSRSPEATVDLGRRVGARLRAGQGIALRGELGAGKTVFVRGLAEGLRVDAPEEVRSPTYLLLVEHPGPLPLLHMDAYFAGRGADFLADGGAAYLQEGGVLAVEWADRLPAAPPADFLDVEILHVAERERRILLRGDRATWGPVVAAAGLGGP